MLQNTCLSISFLRMGKLDRNTLKMIIFLKKQHEKALMEANRQKVIKSDQLINSARQLSMLKKLGLVQLERSKMISNF